jgi:DNA-binding NarL/FixJ family response regulator
MIRVLVADDHHLVRHGITVLLERAEGIEVMGQADNGQQALAMAQKSRPDILLMDIAMPRLNGLLACERLCALDVPTRVVFLSMYSDEVLVRQAIRNGAAGYLLKSAITDELLLAIRTAHQGEFYLSPAVSHLVDEDLLREPDALMDPTEQLTPREREVLQLIAEGLTNRQVANQLHISPKTVDKHRTNLMAKLCVHDVISLVRLAIEQGLVFWD